MYKHFYIFFLFLLLGFSFNVLQAQSTKFEGCSFDGREIDIAQVCDMFGFKDARDAEVYIDKMLDLLGVKRKFQLFQCNNINNCAATKLNVGGMTVPVLIYDNNFLSRLNTYSFSTVNLNSNPQTDWAALSVLAHEIGHLLNFHILQNGGSRPDLELEADEFAGSMIYKLGGSLSDAQKVYQSSLISESGGLSHPPRNQRLLAVKKGYDQAQRLNPRSSTTTPPKKDLPNLPEMVFVSGGTFTMGDTFGEGEADEKPTHEVSLSDYYIGKYEVTLAQFKLFVEATGYKTDAEKEGFSWKWTDKWEKMEGINWRYDAAGNVQSDDRHPVIHVSWNDAVAYAEWASEVSGKRYKLPTEAQWEYAARSRGKEYKYAWGNGSPTRSKGGNVADETKSPTGSSWSPKFEGYTDGYWFTAPVGQFGTNDLGLYDMTGNVWKWCSDWYGSDYYQNSPKSNPQGPSTGTDRVLRGGSWYGNAQHCRVAARINSPPDNRCSGIGFRLVVVP